MRTNRWLMAMQAAAVCAALGFSLHSMAGVVRWQRVLLVGAATLADPAAALAAANRQWQPTASATLSAAGQSDGANGQDDNSLPAQAAPSPAAAPPPTQATPAPTPAPTWDGIVPAGYEKIVSAFYPQGFGEGYVACGRGSLKNCTSLADESLAAEIANGLPFHLQKSTDEPQILIMHTHATESYNLDGPYYFDPDWGARTTDTAQNVCAVGRAMTEVLQQAGFATLHDETLHDYPSYNGSYEASNATVRRYLQQYPSIKVVIDVHRDAIERDGARVKPAAQVQGRTAAQVMLICGCDKNGNLPNFRQNLRFAAAWESKMEERYPGLTRPVLFDYRYYNQDLTTGSLLLEVGGHANTLEEAIYSGQLAASALAAVFEEG